MPLRLNVGASQKVGEANFGSRGASVNVEMELDATLISEPARLQEKIRQLFSHVRASLAEELNGGSTRNGHAAPVPSQSASGPAQGPVAPSGPRNGSGRLATQSQIKALFAITKSQQLNLSQLVRDRFQVARPDDLSIKEASQLIDSLKSARREKG
jgi:hypothetical protein